MVGVGASAGGLEAFTELLSALPSDTGLAFVLVQHLDPVHESALTHLLARATTMPVQEVTNNLRVEIDQVYIIPPNKSLRIVEGVLKLSPREVSGGARTIDFFLKSLAEGQQERAIGVILSGTATDGTLGLEAIKAAGGITFAQDDSAKYDSMPRSAVAAGCVDFTLSPRNIAGELARVARHPYVAGRLHLVHPSPEDDTTAEGAQSDETPVPPGWGTARHTAAAGGHAQTTASREMGKTENPYKKLLLLLRNHSGIDFSLYKPTTIQRRIARRMALTKHEALETYTGFLRGNAGELNALFSDVLICVTSFFRDPKAFDVLQRKVFPAAVHAQTDEPFRVWVLGCATGQEAYSIAMAYVESGDKAPRKRRLQIFATDLNETVLHQGRGGLYPKSLLQDMSPTRLRRFFTEEEGGFRVVKSLRDMIVFARQDLISDPPFSRVDLISCRNLLIYLQPSLQKKALATFHYALKPGGFLFLGASESVGTLTDLFATTDKKHKVYSRIAVTSPGFQLPIRRNREEPPAPVPSSPLISRRAAPNATGGAWDEFQGELNAQREADRVTINQFAPPGVIINAQLHVVQFRGPTSAYFELPSGKASFDVLKMARNGLMLPLRAAIKKAMKDNKPARHENVRITHNESVHSVNLEVIPLRNAKERCFLILFENADKAGPPAAARPKAAKRHGRGTARDNGSADVFQRIAELEAELSETREYLQSMQEQHEASNEELQASVEEVQSSNEELQSVNEEVETSKEELESTNEELTTVNEEMTNRNAELNRLNSDLINFQSSTRLAIILLGRDLTIRHFSAQAGKDFKLLAADVGRPIGRIRHNLVLVASESPPDLEVIIGQVVDSMREREFEVRDTEGHWYSLRIAPYVTIERKLDGAVLLLVDITQRKRIEAEVEAARDYAEAIVRTAPDPLVILNADLRVHSANEAFFSTFKVSRTESAGRRIYELGNGQWDIPRLRQLLEEILPRDKFFAQFEVEHDFEGIGRRKMLLNASKLDIHGSQAPQILLGINDVTAVLQFQAEAQESAGKFRLLFERSPLSMWTMDLETQRFMDVNEAALKHYRYSRADFLRMTALDICTPESAAALRAALARPPHVPPDLECAQHRTRRGDVIDVEIRGSEIVLSGRRVWLATVSDVTERERVQLELEKAARQKDEFLAMLAHELRNPLAPIRNAAQILQISEGDTDLVRRAAAMIERQMRHVSRLVDDLLDASRISLGKIELLKQRVELAAVVNEAVEASRPSVETKNQKVQVTLPPHPIFLNADPTRLTQLIGNLLHNASKFTGNGGSIWVSVEQEIDRAVVRVQDTGIGIADDQLHRIFELFVQGNRSLERSEGGLGIGLMLVKRLAEMHGGTIEARSSGPNLGSEFTLRLPLFGTESPVAVPGTVPSGAALTP
ncbi:MAG TPA: chemotaxis protein CheB [Gemmatimonadaceae bacterium]|nr:chemotaxis protein CheB [Gemmatimonadaceae bacterium]